MYYHSCCHGFQHATGYSLLVNPYYHFRAEGFMEYDVFGRFARGYEPDSLRMWWHAPHSRVDVSLILYFRAGYTVYLFSYVFFKGIGILQKDGP